LQYLTYKFRLKDGGNKRKQLLRWASAVNTVWNYCNEASYQTLRKHSKWLSFKELTNLTAGSNKELELQSQVVQQVCKEYVRKRVQTKRQKLSWRKSHGSKRSLGWIPCTNQNIVVYDGQEVVFNKKTFKFWKSREIPDTIKSVSFNEDARGRWYVNFVCEVEEAPQYGMLDLGVDLGIKTQATISDGRKFERENLTKKYEDRLAMAQRARKKKLVRTIQTKIANIRKDWNHKTANAILKDARLVVIGDVSCTKLAKTKMAKSVLDSAWGQLRLFLRYKAIRLGTIYMDQNESWTTIPCSDCFERTGPSGLRGLSIREWVCSNCGSIHDRDVNAARNILRLGLQTPIKGISTVKKRKSHKENEEQENVVPA